MQFSVNGAVLGYDDVGQGPAIVFVHAFPLNRTMWAAQLRAVQRAGYRALAPDLRGFGESDVPGSAVTLDRMAEDLIALLDHVALPRATFVGLSMGGYVLFRLLERSPERIERLVLADTRAGPDTPEAAATRLQRAATAEQQGVAPVVESMLAGMLAGGYLDAANPALVEHVRSLMLSAPPAGFANAQRAMAARPDSTELLPRIQCPALVLCGEQDVLTPPAEAQAMAARIPHARLVLLADAGHLSNIEQPEAFNAALLEFLAAR